MFRRKSEAIKEIVSIENRMKNLMVPSFFPQNVCQNRLFGSKLPQLVVRSKLQGFIFLLLTAPSSSFRFFQTMNYRAAASLVIVLNIVNAVERTLKNLFVTNVQKKPNMFKLCRFSVDLCY